MRIQSISICLVGMLLAAWPAYVRGETFDSIQPRTCKPGQTTQITIHGKDLQAPLHLALPHHDVAWKLEKVEPTAAVVSLTIPADHPLGPLPLWLAAQDGAVQTRTILIDDLEAVADIGANHSPETAQAVSTLASIEGICDASVSDYYRFHATASQRVAFEVHTQALHSAMDPVCRIFDAAGKTLLQADDTQVGPDTRFSFEFPVEGDYWIEIHDNRNAAAGAPYQLRIGDFPIVSQAMPLAAQHDQPTSVAFLGQDAQLVAPQEVKAAPSSAEKINVRAKTADGQSSTWVPLLTSRYPQVMESSEMAPLAAPIGITGRLENGDEVDSYVVKGTKGQTVRIAAKTRSLNSPTVLQMQLRAADGNVIAETKVTGADEWSMVVAFTEDGDYRLEVSDLLKRGGAEFAYHVEIVPAGTFSVALAGDAKTREQFPVAIKKGACAFDLSVARFGYDGDIDLSLPQSDRGFRILNARIPAGANSFRVHVGVDDTWRVDQLEVLKLRATAVGDPTNSCLVSSHAIRRAKEPFVLSPNPDQDGAILLAAIGELPPIFSLAPAAPVEFARPVASHSATLPLKRIHPEFKSGVEVLTGTISNGWTGQVTAEKDNYTITLTRGATPEPDQLTVTVFGEIHGKGSLENVAIPIKWFDPVQVALTFPETIVRGGPARVVATVTRAGGDPQPVTLRLTDLPAGITAPETITVDADQTTAEFDVQLPGDVPLDSPLALTWKAASKYRGQDFEVSSSHPLPNRIDSPQQLALYPTSIQLNDPLGRQRIVATGSDQAGAARDWTQQARITSSRPEVAEVRNGVVYPLADGDAEITVQIGGAKQTIPVQVSNRATTRPLEFESEVLVALSKQGCNQGACHGSPSGKGGFRLSLRAFDMQLDELTLIREESGRRINTIEPEKSLLLLKPLMSVAHGGGKQINKQDEAYAILRDWIGAGAAADPPNMPRIKTLEVYPAEKQVRLLADGPQQLAATAHFTDGHSRDVTHLVAYESSNKSVATVDANGLVTPHERGEVVVLVRFLEHIEPVSLMFVENQPGYQWASAPPNNYVDELVNAKLQQLQYLPAETCSDSEFVRRIHLDLLGVLPTVAETNAFLSDTSPNKRAALIDALLERDEYAKFWALKWGDLLKMTSKEVGDEGVFKYHRWVESSLKNNMPYDEFARKLITGSGSTLANPPANFYRTSADLNQCVETISQVFLGARLQCAKCHNHPFERWTQDNYYGLGAFFNRVEHRKTERPGEMFIYTSYAGEVTQPRTGKVMTPWLPQVGSIERQPDVDQRVAFAEWLVNPENPYFARIEANRIWSQLFARGIVEPIDDFRDSNPPANGPLLDALAKEFVDSGYDRKQLLRTILSSRTYQASYKTNDMNRDETIYFSHQLPRMLSAEQLLDAINRTLSLHQNFGSLPPGTLATQLPAPDLAKNEFLKAFGQPERSTVCACERSDDTNLGMAIELFNGPLVQAKLKDGNNRFRKGLAEGKSVQQVVEELYLAAVCRSPSELELKTALEHCSKNPDPAIGLEDVCWALFNTEEFLFQH
ncbi:DUF1549 domain-containing protein [Blastopirellula sp. JC732]|uniref:DUF1549 domain-containing protein n=1 Tax=Blastopirellula sediminis TaxID=2894196 RepID=A0A9X1MNI8_9BACT|nr:DUF1549 domain-containing protein [Blastopirellula sediminis]MCC9608494.1 DUF1549 domain-containing protein [Blastopirellula sediminis]MCC9628729.1 DUF1549 domain-containing protein [Blastopirellula sediminis]